jgi:hypothetical protein
MCPKDPKSLKGDSLKDQLKETLDEAEWTWLRPHVARDALIVVKPDLDLLEVAVKVARDEKKQIQDWIARGWIGKPSHDQLTAWEKAPTKRFLSVVVQPYVLIQEQMLH